MNICIVIVNYNGLAFQNECIQSLLESSFQDFIIVVVDNKSTDESMNALDIFNDKRIVKIFNDDNYGVAYANNIGINESLSRGCSATLLLNNDTVIEKKALSLMVEQLYCYPVVSPKILYHKKNKIWYCGGYFDFNKGTAIHKNMGEDSSEFSENAFCDYAPTCCLLIRNDIFEKVGLMDDKYFIYCDDTDFCFRLYKHNINILVLSDAIIYHKVSSSTGGDHSPLFLYYGNRNRLYFLKKYRKQIPYRAFVFALASRYVKAIFGNKNERHYIKKAIRDFKKNVMGKANLQ